MICRKKKTTARCEAVRWEPLTWWPGYDVGRMVGSGAVIQTGQAVAMVLVLGCPAEPVHPGQWIIRFEPTELEPVPQFVDVLTDEQFRAAYDEMHDAA